MGKLCGICASLVSILEIWEQENRGRRYAPNQGLRNDIGIIYSPVFSRLTLGIP